jgi:hypothetical protein
MVKLNIKKFSRSKVEDNEDQNVETEAITYTYTHN